MERPDEAAAREREARIRNLQAVARHLAQGGAVSTTGRVEAGQGAGRSLGGWKAWGAAGVVLALLAGKLKLLVPLFKFAKLGTLLSMVLSIGVYSSLWGLPYAAGFVLLILVHELGHAIVLWQQGIPAGAPVFIPFVGAVIAMKGLPRNAYVEALVGIGGPVLGSAGALVCLVVGWATGSMLWYALASSGFMINLFNLLPVRPLDGGRIVGVISRWLWAVGYAIGIAVFVLTRSPLLLIILALGVFELWRTLRHPVAGYFLTSTGRRVAMGVAYFGLAALLALGMWAADSHLERLHPPAAAAAGG